MTPIAVVSAQSSTIRQSANDRVPLTPTPTVNLAIIVQASGVPPWSTDRDIGVRRTGTADLPPADITAVMLSRALIEVLSARRCAHQLSAHCAPHVFAGLSLHIPPVARSLPRLQAVRVCEPADGIAEACAVFRSADRVRALAFRLAGLDGRWRITVLQIG